MVDNNRRLTLTAKGLEEIYRSWRDVGRDPATAFVVAIRLLIEAAERETDDELAKDS